MLGNNSVRKQIPLNKHGCPRHEYRGGTICTGLSDKQECPEIDDDKLGIFDNFVFLMKDIIFNIVMNGTKK